MATIWDTQNRIVFQRGVAWQKDSDGQWHCEGTDENVGRITAKYMVEELQLRPLRIYPDVQYTHSLLLPFGRGGALDIELAEIEQRRILQMSSDGTIASADARNLRVVMYNMQCVLYHCKQLSQSYVSTVAEFTKWPNPPTLGDRVGFASMEPFFEFDALVTAVVRTLDSLRRPIWNKFGNPGSMPSSFNRVLDDTSIALKMPRHLFDKLALVRTNWFDKAKEYRDCVQHYYSPGSAGPRSIMERRTPGLWTLTAWLPDEPSRSLDEFKFTKQIDVLDYGWELTTRAVDALAVVMDIYDPAA